MSEEITPQQVLDLQLGDNDSGEATVRGYLLRLLRAVWSEGEEFDGKRPFGNSSWDYELKIPMVKAGLISGKLDSDGYVEHLDDEAADALVLAAIKALDAPREAGDEPQAHARRSSSSPEARRPCSGSTPPTDGTPKRPSTSPATESS